MASWRAGSGWSLEDKTRGIRVRRVGIDPDDVVRFEYADSQIVFDFWVTMIADNGIELRSSWLVDLKMLAMSADIAWKCRHGHDIPQEALGAIKQSVHEALLHLGTTEKVPDLIVNFR